ncbi:MAG: hypothetical protein DRN20_02975 [Thermoplasmata archaeon]|nr:MAG: hypothetical protein DRN20_02975 [Thermoplasmata archaeon]
MREYIVNKFPELQYIKDERLRSVVINIWAECMKEGGWNDLDSIPFTLLIKDCKKSLVEHTRVVTKMALAVGKEREDINMDLLIAGALLHDVGKLLEYRAVEGRVVKSELGKRVRHPVYGAMKAMAMGYNELAHIILAHSKEGDYVERTPEAIIVHHCDFIDFECEKAKYAREKVY